MNSLQDIKNKYNIVFGNDDKKYEQDILTIFNTEHITDTSNCILLNWTGIYYEYEKQDRKNGKHYYLLAIEKGSYNAIINISELYYKERNFDKIKYYREMAIEKYNCALSMNKLAILYAEYHHDYKNANRYYLMALDNSNDITSINIVLENIYINMSYTEFTNSDLDILIKNYNKNTTRINKLINDLKQPQQQYIHEKLGSSCKCYICYEMNQKLRSFKQVVTCDICTTSDIDCIPYGWCGHYICVPCYYILKSGNKLCPYCRQ